MWLGQPEANPSWKTWFLTFFLISFFFFLLSPPFTRKIRTTSSSTTTTTYDKHLSHKKQSYSRSKKSFLQSASLFFFFLTHEIQRHFFSLLSVTSLKKHTQNIHTSVTMNTELIHTCTVELKKGLSVLLSFSPHLSGFHTLLGLAYIAISRFGMGGGRGQERGDGVMQWISNG